MRVLCGFVCSVFLIFSASANDTANSVDGGAQVVLAAAVATAATQADLRYAFTIDHWSDTDGEEIALRVRFDPRLPAGEQWRLIDVNEDDLEKPVRKGFQQLQKTENADAMLVYDKIGEVLDGAVLMKDMGGEALFVAVLKDDDLPDGAIEAFITLNKTGGYISRVELRSKQAFKPNPMVKIKSMVQSQEYAAPMDGGPALLRKSESTVEGNAMLKSFTSRERRIFSDIELIDPAEIAATQEDG